MTLAQALVALKALGLALYDPTQIKMLLALVAADVLLAIALNLWRKQFALGQVADFLQTRLVPYFLAYTAVQLVALADPSLGFTPAIIWAAIVLTEVGRILASLKEIGLEQIPRALTK